MKKNLLILTLALFVISVSAQTSVTAQSKTGIKSESNQPKKKNQRKQFPNPSIAGANNCVFPPNDDKIMGQSCNILGVDHGTRTNLWYDKITNTMTFVHCSKISGNIRYEYSSTQGVTWNINHDSLYVGSVVVGAPQGVIYNASGAPYVNAFAPSVVGTNLEGTSQIGSWTNKQQAFPVRSIPDGMQIIKNTGVIWIAGEGINANGKYNDTIMMGKGTYSNGDFNYDFTHSFYAPLNTFADISTAWSDDGATGYVVVSGNDQSPFVDSIYYPIVYKTTDSGSTWNKITGYNTNMNLSLLGNPGDTISTAFDVDCAMDMNNNLHIAIDVGVFAHRDSLPIDSIKWGIFDIYTSDSGATWYAQLLYKPMTMRGVFGDYSVANPCIKEDNRPSVTRSWDGSKIFISWFDTDTNNIPGVGNIDPDWWVRGFDITTMGTTNLWTDPIYMTDANTTPFGACTFANLSYYSVTHGTDEWLPMVYAPLVSTIATGSPVTFHYFDGACVQANSYTNPTNPCLIKGVSRCNILNGVNEINPNKSIFTVSANYPNPFTGATMVDVMLTKPADVTIEVSNMVGQVLSTKTYKNLSSGKNQLTIDASGFASGLYLYKVKVGEEMVSRTMSVK